MSSAVLYLIRLCMTNVQYMCLEIFRSKLSIPYETAGHLETEEQRTHTTTHLIKLKAQSHIVGIYENRPTKIKGRHVGLYMAGQRSSFKVDYFAPKGL